MPCPPPPTPAKLVLWQEFKTVKPPSKTDEEIKKKNTNVRNKRFYCSSGIIKLMIKYHEQFHANKFKKLQEMDRIF